MIGDILVIAYWYLKFYSVMGNQHPCMFIILYICSYLFYICALKYVLMVSCCWVVLYMTAVRVNGTQFWIPLPVLENEIDSRTVVTDLPTFLSSSVHLLYVFLRLVVRFEYIQNCYLLGWTDFSELLVLSLIILVAFFVLKSVVVRLTPTSCWIVCFMAPLLWESLHCSCWNELLKDRTWWYCELIMGTLTL